MGKAETAVVMKPHPNRRAEAVYFATLVRPEQFAVHGQIGTLLGHVVELRIAGVGVMGWLRPRAAVGRSGQKPVVVESDARGRHIGERRRAIEDLERRVIERVKVTVEVTRLHRVIETPKPTIADVVPPAFTPTAEITATVTSNTPTPTAPKPTAATPRPTVPSARAAGNSLLTALQNTEQMLLSLVQALNSNPLPVDATVQIYNVLRSAASVTIPDNEDELLSIYTRYREQVDTTVGQGNDLYTHLVQIQAGEASQTELSPIHLSLARDAASASTSAVQALLRELETFLTSLP